MTTFVLICLGVIAMCSLMTFLFMIFFLSGFDDDIHEIKLILNEFDELISENKSITEAKYMTTIDIRNYLLDIRELKREKARKKCNCSSERDLK